MSDKKKVLKQDTAFLDPVLNPDSKDNMDSQLRMTFGNEPAALPHMTLQQSSVTIEDDPNVIA